jgi:hypothetical protein
MIEFVQHYFQYRRVGFGRMAAFRLALLVGGARRRGGAISAR